MNIVERYLEYLNEPALQYNGKVEKPSRDSTIKKLQLIEEKIKQSDLASMILQDAINNNKLLCWSDHHFNHDMLWKNNLRPFNSREEMNEKMLNSLSDIKKDDVLLFGGDFCFYNIKEILEKINDVDCVKVYIVGNHDVRDNSFINQIMKSFSAITIAATFKMNNDEIDKDVFVSHYPIGLNKLLEKEVNLHGHTHKYLMGEKYINMCVEHTEYGLKNFNDLYMSQKKLIRSKKLN